MSRAFGSLVRKQRLAKGLTQRQVATALGFRSTAYLSDIEAGNRKPARDLLAKLAGILDLPTEALAGEDPRTHVAAVRAYLEARPADGPLLRAALKRIQVLGAAEALRRMDSPRLPEVPSAPPSTAEPTNSVTTKRDAIRSESNPAPKRHPREKPASPSPELTLFDGV